jgi:phytoene synthase
LPAEVRQRAFALYAFCRLSDDAVDLSDSSPCAIRRLTDRLARAAQGQPRPFAADRALADAMRRSAIPAAIPEALLEGLAWDAEGRTYETLDDLLDYATRVAGTVGVMMALVMGVRSSDALARACHLGNAMQLTNIARDVGEDARMGRIYLPRQWLSEAGVNAEAFLSDPKPDPRIRGLVRRLLDEAQTLYQQGQGGIALLPANCRPAIMAAGLIYAEIGAEVERNGFDSVTVRARVSGRRKLELLVRAVVLSGRLAAGPPLPAPACGQFLIDAVQNGRPAPKRPSRPFVEWRESAIVTLDLFERLRRADRLGA